MAERRNGSFSQNRRKHGSDQRGVAAVPRGPRTLDYLQQSQKDKAKSLYKITQRHQERLNEKTTGYGNRNLPAFKHKQEIVELVESYKAIILGGPTGSGKSTQVPQFLLEAGYEKIYMLVPRRIIADGLHERLIHELAEHLGEDEAKKTVGIVHGERSEYDENSRIIAMTPNTFVRMESDIRSQYADKKVAIVADEIHEANLHTEIATGVAAKAVAENENGTWRVIAASATHNSGPLQASFRELNGGFVPAVNIEGRPFEVDIQQASDESPMQTYARMGHEHEKSMIFTSGKNEIDHIIDEIRKTISAVDQEDSDKVVFRKLHGDLSEVELAHINDPIPDGYRLVIVSSPAGMSGITIPGVTLVVSDGTINRSELDDDAVSGLTRRYLSHAEIIQQMGRAGRDVSGGVGVLAAPTSVKEDKIRAKGRVVEVEQMPFMSLEDRELFGPPEIYNSNLSQVVLGVSNLDRSFSEINSYLPNQVEASRIIQAEESLARLGALDDDDVITDRGRQMSQFPVRPELSRGIAEAVKQGRPLAQLTRIAIIAAALETGGVQDFYRDSEDNWKRLLRPTTTDDIIAQLDLVSSQTSTDEQEYVDHLSRYDLNYKRMKRTQKVTRKILHTLGVRFENVVLQPPSMTEETELRNDITAGMIDFVYQPSRIINRRQHYKNIHSGEESTQRFISNRSLVSPRIQDYVAGFPRWYETALKQGGRKRHDVIELLMPVDARVVGQYAEETGILERSNIDASFVNGQVVERYQRSFGSIAVGKLETGVVYEEIPQKSQELLVHHVLQTPRQAQKAIREIVDEIEYYQKRLPDGQLRHFLQPNAPELITRQSIEDLVKELAKKTRQAHEVDQGLAQYIFHNNISIQRYFSEEAREELRRRAPSEIIVDDTPIQLHYDDARQPYIIGSNKSVRSLVAGRELKLADDRDVLVQINQPGHGKVRVKTTDL